MATAAPNISLPLFYNAIEPLNVTQHGKMKVRPVEKSPQIGQTHAIPVTVDEFGLAQRHFPIVFSVGDNPDPDRADGLERRRQRIPRCRRPSARPERIRPGLHPPLSVPARAA